MILVRLVIQTKWGKADEVVAMFKKEAELMRRLLGPNTRGRILTDISGPFHTVVQELEVESLAKWEELRTAMFSDPEVQERQVEPEHPDTPFLSGQTEFYTIEMSLDPE
jgi:hypothetical protein